MEDKINILIVDDESAMRDGLADVLEEKGYDWITKGEA